MTHRTRTYPGVPGLLAEFEGKHEAIRKRLEEFARVRPEEYFYELAYCLCTPQSSAVNAARAVELMRSANIQNSHDDPLPFLHHKTHYIRFHNTKAQHLMRARELFPEIRLALLNGHTSHQLREWLVLNVKGLGWKEASHFLRNIGHRNLAILDRHILRNLKEHRVIRSLPASLSRRTYLDTEQRFLAFAGWVGISVDELDLLFWSRETGEILK
ncbi:MAG: N-glycosylase/DNA lyase [Ignavibacteria bacterium]|nr:N-glycosylase/DNA lyase [Ignavibacteria bacterium]